jgi:hypothetical protein
MVSELGKFHAEVPFLQEGFAEFIISAHCLRSAIPCQSQHPLKVARAGCELRFKLASVAKFRGHNRVVFRY